MSKTRMINTRFWDDDYASNLDPIEKLLFLYFLTNTSTNISGIYEIPIKKIAVETGIDKEMVLKVLARFTRDGKIFYHNGWVGIKNFIKHQNQRSPHVQKGIEAELSNISKDILENMVRYGYPMDTLSHLNLNLNLNSNLNTNLNTNLDMNNKCIQNVYKKEITPVEEARLFFDNPEETIKEFISKTGMSEELLTKEVNKFIFYWTEKNKSGTKQRWEQQNTFEVKKRLAVWLSKIGNFTSIRKETKII
jgi:hypothetical protein